jgi:hypothetical protein
VFPSVARDTFRGAFDVVVEVPHSADVADGVFGRLLLETEVDAPAEKDVTAPHGRLNRLRHVVVQPQGVNDVGRDVRVRPIEHRSYLDLVSHGANATSGIEVRAAARFPACVSM